VLKVRILLPEGRDVEALGTRDEVWAAFGAPPAPGHNHRRAYDEFHTRKKVPDLEPLDDAVLL
jgi:hypothetical protein